MPIKVNASTTFAWIAKKLHADGKKTLDSAVKKSLLTPSLETKKRVDLSGVFVYIFKLNKQETSMAHELMPNKPAPDELVLLGLGHAKISMPS